MASHPREWNSTQYHQLSDPQFQWGLKVLDRVMLRGDETVLDAGCGTGRVTAELTRRLPKGRVIASDVSENMLAGAREHLHSQFNGRVSYVRADMADLPLENEVDIVFSTAAFHWVKDHDALFRSLFRALKPGGHVVAQCGGGPNLEIIRGRADRLISEDRVLRSAMVAFENPWVYALPEQTTGRLRRAGFADAEAWLQSTPTTIDDPDRYHEFLRTVILRAHISHMPSDAAEHLLERMTELGAKDKPAFTLDYWRLNIDARKAS
ncbi:UbiE/COQ5 methyltransferase [Candidatus Koribacter versatilis Ellin345]|uniref:UbiE/COQ5 methyltransferase n=1 Tax=Koribacter versatilis (strain Ellin345) TaxID=204669 RepID=Q1IQV0_KORVE|nr:class I SAM-dependent methyltransferase [Candidatus Koribacter versatilis]ABF40750.1 UbiE/COQ5 methyltransferase [Candidatus Koribacter versatilis Ellin345]